MKSYTPVGRQNDEAQIQLLHRRVLAGDDDALNQLATVLMKSLHNTLRLQWRGVSTELVATAVEDAILDYARRPGAYDPARHVPLPVFLRHSASRNLTNLVAKERRRLLAETQFAAGTDAVATSTPRIEREDLLGPAISAIDAVVRVTPAIEQAALMAWLRGERSTKLLARSLNLFHLPSPEQSAEVKRFKDRVRRRLQRAVKSMDEVAVAKSRRK